MVTRQMLDDIIRKDTNDIADWAIAIEGLVQGILSFLVFTLPIYFGVNYLGLIADVSEISLLHSAIISAALFIQLDVMICIAKGIILGFKRGMVNKES